MRTASSAVRAPDVLGSRVTPLGMKSKMLSCSLVLARRTASVIISAPAYLTALSIRLSEYLPEPSIKRD